MAPTRNEPSFSLNPRQVMLLDSFRSGMHPSMRPNWTSGNSLATLASESVNMNPTPKMRL